MRQSPKTTLQVESLENLTLPSSSPLSALLHPAAEVSALRAPRNRPPPAFQVNYGQTAEGKSTLDVIDDGRANRTQVTITGNKIDIRDGSTHVTRSLKGIDTVRVFEEGGAGKINYKGPGKTSRSVELYGGADGATIITRGRVSVVNRFGTYAGVTMPKVTPTAPPVDIDPGPGFLPSTGLPGSGPSEPVTPPVTPPTNPGVPVDVGFVPRSDAYVMAPAAQALANEIGSLFKATRASYGNTTEVTLSQRLVYAAANQAKQVQEFNFDSETIIQAPLPTLADRMADVGYTLPISEFRVTGDGLTAQAVVNELLKDTTFLAVLYQPEGYFGVGVSPDGRRVVLYAGVKEV